MATEPEKDEREGLLAAKLDSLPARPGCYLFYDKNRACVYVGKAKSLRSRVRSYFQEGSGDERYFIPLLRKIVTDLETVVTSTEICVRAKSGADRCTKPSEITSPTMPI